MIKRIFSIIFIFILGTLQVNAACKNDAVCDIEFIFEPAWEAMACGSEQENYYIIKSNIPVSTPLSSIIDILPDDTSPNSTVEPVGGSCENGLPAYGTCQLNVLVTAAPCPSSSNEKDAASFPQFIDRNLEVRPQTIQEDPIVANIQLEVFAGPNIQFVEPLPTIDNMYCGNLVQDLTYTVKAHLTENDIPFIPSIANIDGTTSTVAFNGGSCITAGVIPAIGSCDINVRITSALCTAGPFPQMLERALVITPTDPSIAPISSGITPTINSIGTPIIKITSINPSIPDEILCNTGSSQYTYTVASINATGAIAITNAITPADAHVTIANTSCTSIPLSGSCDIFVNIDSGTCDGTFPVNINTNLVVTPTNTSISPVSSPIVTDLVNIPGFSKAYIANDNVVDNSGLITICDVNDATGDLINCFNFSDTTNQLGRAHDIILNNEGTVAYIATSFASSINPNQIFVYHVDSETGELLDKIQNYQNPSFDIIFSGLRIFENQLYVVNTNFSTTGIVTVCDLNTNGTIASCSDATITNSSPAGRMGFANTGGGSYKGYFANYSNAANITSCNFPLSNNMCTNFTSPDLLIGLDVNEDNGYVFVMHNIPSNTNTLYSCKINGFTLDPCNPAGLVIPDFHSYTAVINLFMQSVNGSNFGYIPDAENNGIQRCTITSTGTVTGCSLTGDQSLIDTPVSTWIHPFSESSR